MWQQQQMVQQQMQQQHQQQHHQQAAVHQQAQYDPRYGSLVHSCRAYSARAGHAANRAGALTQGVSGVRL